MVQILWFWKGEGPTPGQFLGQRSPIRGKAGDFSPILIVLAVILIFRSANGTERSEISDWLFTSSLGMRVHTYEDKASSVHEFTFPFPETLIVRSKDRLVSMDSFLFAVSFLRPPPELSRTRGPISSRLYCRLNICMRDMGKRGARHDYHQSTCLLFPRFDGTRTASTKFHSDFESKVFSRATLSLPQKQIVR